MITYGGRPVVGFGDAPTCPSNPPPPPGFTIWKGSVPNELRDWAIILRDHVAEFPYGQQWTMRWNDITVMARKDHHTWTFKSQGDGTTVLVKDICIPGITLYRSVLQTGVTGVGADSASDPATAQPDQHLALFTDLPPDRINWRLVAWSAAAGAATVGLFALALHTAGSAR